MVIDEKAETKTKTKKQKNILDIKLPKEGVILDKGEVYSIKLISNLDFASKCSIYIELKVRSATYDYQYNEAKQKNGAIRLLQGVLVTLSLESVKVYT